MKAGATPATPRDFIDTSFENASPLWYGFAPDDTVRVNLNYDHERAHPWPRLPALGKHWINSGEGLTQAFEAYFAPSKRGRGWRHATALCLPQRSSRSALSQPVLARRTTARAVGGTGL